MPTTFIVNPFAAFGSAQEWNGTLLMAQFQSFHDDGYVAGSTVFADAASLNLGIKAVRHSILIPHVTVTPGTPGTYDFSELDADWTEMQSRGIRAYAYAFDGFDGETAYPDTSTERSQWAWACRAALEYAEANHPGLVAALEIWNEPDGTWPIPAADYVLLAAAVKSVVRANPALNNIPLVGPATILEPAAYWDALISAGLLPQVDWVSIHTYSEPNEQDAFWSGLQAKLAAAGAGSKIRVQSEYNSENALVPARIAGHLTMAKRHGARAANYFPIRMYSGFPTIGLMTATGAQAPDTPIWITWHAIIGEGATYVGKDAALDPVQSHQFSVSGAEVRCVWSPSVRLIDVTGSYTAKNALGQVIAAGGQHTLLQDVPIYLFGDITISLAPVTGPNVWLSTVESSITLVGSDVSVWSDASVLGNGDFSQGTSGSRPNLVSAVVNGEDAIRFNGTTDWLGTTATMADILGSTGYTIFAVVKVTVPLVEEGRIVNDNFANMALEVTTASNLVLRHWDGGTFAAATVAISGATWYVAEGGWDGSILHLRVNGGADATSGTVGMAAQLTNVMQLGKTQGFNANFIAMDLAELTTFNVWLADAERAVERERLMTRYFAPNQPPVVAIPLVDQTATTGAPFSYQFAAGSFTDPESGTLTYTATLSDGSPLPAWLTFNPATRTFTGTPP